MRRVTIAVFSSVAAFGSFATTASRAMPVAPLAAPPLEVEVQANRVCNAEGWCWFLPYYRPYGYYRYRYRYDADEPLYLYRPRSYYDRPHDWVGYGGWDRR